MIVAISKDPNIQNAIEELGKLKAGGADIGGDSVPLLWGPSDQSVWRQVQLGLLFRE